MKHAMKHAAATYEEGEAAAEYHRRVFEEAHRLIREGDQKAVSYTHLTLPTNREV